MKIETLKNAIVDTEVLLGIRRELDRIADTLKARAAEDDRLKNAADYTSIAAFYLETLTEPAQELFEYVSDKLSREDHCDQSFRHTMKWLKEHCPKYEDDVIRNLLDSGIHCDCELARRFGEDDDVPAHEPHGAKYQLNIHADDGGVYTLNYNGDEWSVRHNGKIVLPRMNAATVAGFIAGRLDGISGEMVERLAWTLENIEQMTGDILPF